MTFTKDSLRTFLSKRNRVVFLIFFLSLSVRFIYLQEIRTNPFFENPISDAQWHVTWARDIARGNWIGEQVFFRAPLYPYFLSITYTIFGHSHLIPRLIQMILGSFSCVLIFFIARMLFNRRIGIIAALIASFYSIFVYFDGELLIPSLIVFLNLLLILSLLRNIRKSKPIAWFFSGIIFGLSAIARPNVLVFAIGIFLWLIIHKKRKELLRTCVFLLLGVSVVIIPITVRNYLVGRDFVLISSQGGINYYIGNNPITDGKRSVAPGLHMATEDDVDNVWLSSVQIAQRKMGKRLRPSEVSGFWFNQAFQFLKDKPFDFIKLQFRKIYYFWNAYEIESNKNIYTYRKYSFILKILIWIFGLAFPFGVIGPLSIVGMYICRKQWRKLILLYMFVCLYMFSVIAFFVTSRFRVPILPFLIIFASCSVFWLYEKMKARRYRDCIIPCVIFVTALVFINLNLFGVREKDLLREHFFLGYVYGENGLYDKAIGEYTKALQTPYDPCDPLTRSNVHHNLGFMYRKKGLYSEAEREYLAAIRMNPEHTRAYCNLGTLYAIVDLADKAEWAYRQALSINPHYKAARMNLEMLLRKREVPSLGNKDRWDK